MKNKPVTLYSLKARIPKLCRFIFFNFLYGMNEVRKYQELVNHICYFIFSLQEKKTKRINRARLHYLFFRSLQLLFVLFAGLFLQTKALAKLYQIQMQDSDEILQRLKEEKSEPGQAVDEISGARNKRQVPVSLRTVCPGMYQSTSSTRPSKPCVKGWYYCPKYNVFEAVCKRVSVKCLSSISTHGIPKCSPVYKTLTVDLRNGGRKTLKITKTCRCA